MSDFFRSKKILLTGGHGFVGKHVMQELIRKGASEENIINTKSKEFDLRKKTVCNRLSRHVDIVIHLAGNVGGIGYNQLFPGELFYDNITMGINLIEAARINGVKKFVQIGTICAYPKFAPIPFKEEDLWNGYPEETNAPYGIAKKALLVMLQAYRQQYGFNGIYLLPVNMYGPGDNFDPTSSHVIAALIRKIASAKLKKQNSITVWGDGSATREFLFVKDAAKAIVLAAEKYDQPEPINIGAGFEISIKDLVDTLTKIMHFNGKIVWDTTKPNGQPRRKLDTNKASELFGFRATTNFKDGLRQTVNDFFDRVMYAQ